MASDGKLAGHRLLVESVVLLIQHPTGRLGLGIVGLFVVFAIGLPSTSILDPLGMSRGAELLAPSGGHVFGTDEFGRDILSRTIYGARVSLGIAAVAVLLAGLPGVTLGLIGGYVGGRIDGLLMRLWDGLLAFPTVLFAIAVAAILGPGPLNAAAAIGIVGLPQFARIVRASTLTEREREYVEAARATGTRTSRIIWRHVLPNVLAPVIVQIALAMGYAVLLEAGLSFLGLGLQPPEPSLGGMLSESRTYLYQAWWFAFFPGIAIVFLLLGLNWVAEALNDVLNPHWAAGLRPAKARSEKPGTLG